MLEVESVVADFARPFTLPLRRRPLGRTLVFFPGAAIDGYEPFEAVALLATLRVLAGKTGRLLLAADGTRDREALLRAYDDCDGVTAALNKNALVHLDRERGIRLDPTVFEHRAVWNDRCWRVELQLVCLRDQCIAIGSDHIELAAGESITTEYAYKHDLHAMRGLLFAGGWQVRHVFTAEEQPMRLWLCEPRGG